MGGSNQELTLASSLSPPPQSVSTLVLYTNVSTNAPTGPSQAGGSRNEGFKRTMHKKKRETFDVGRHSTVGIVAFPEESVFVSTGNACVSHRKLA